MTAKQIVIAIFILLAAIAAVVFSLTGESEVKVSNEEEFVEYVSAYTTGIISRESTIKIRLVKPFQWGETNKIPSEFNYLQFSPKVEGELYWVDDQTIEFSPDKQFKPGTRYTATFNVGRLVQSDEKISPFIFEFETIKRELEVEMRGFTALSKKDFRLQKLSGYVETSDVEILDDIKNIISAKYEEAEAYIKWIPGAGEKIFNFEIDSLVRQEDEKKIKIEWNASSIGIESFGVKYISLPALNQFDVSSVDVVSTREEQYVRINFTDPLKEIQNLNGLINLNDISGLKYEIRNNAVIVYPPTRLYGEYSLDVNQGISNSLNFKMKSNYKSNLVFENIQPAVRFVGNGVIVPDSENGFILPFEAVNLSAVDIIVTKIYENNLSQFMQVNNLQGSNELRRVGKNVIEKIVPLNQSGLESLHKWNRFILDLNELSNKEVGAVYRVKIGFRKSQSLYYCEKDEDDIAEENNRRNQYGRSDDNEYWRYYDDYDYYDYDWRHRDDPCYESYYGNRRAVSKNLMQSNIGIIAKKGTDGSLFLATTHIPTGKPLSEVTLQVLDFQKQELIKLETNDEGIATADLEEKAFLVLAEKGDEKGYLRIDDGSSLSISKFDVSGSAVKKGIKGFIYGDRGVWRPGDSLYITFILEDLKNNIPEEHPIIFELKNPKRQLVNRFVEKRNENDFYTFKFSTDPEAQTGNWNAEISLGGVKFNKNLKIETVKPNRLKIKFDMDKPYLTNSTDEEVSLFVNWLHGAVGKNLKAKIDVTLNTIHTSFKNFNGFNFDDPRKRFKADPKTIFDGSIDSKGHAKIKINIPIKSPAPGKLRANLLTKAFEPGGDFSIDKFSIDYNPYKTYVGIKLPKVETGWGLLSPDKDQEVEIATVDMDGNSVSSKHIKLKIQRLNWSWWWDHSGNQSNYSSSDYPNDQDEEIITTVNGKGKWKFNIKSKRGGRYFISATDLDGKHSTGKHIYVGQVNSFMKNQPSGSSMLSFSADKEKYKVGEEIELTIPGGETGRSLISIETGSRIIETHWLEMRKGLNKFKFTATQEMTPNIYAHVTLIQPHSQTANDLPIRLYGIIPISIENPETHISPKITMPEVLRPEKSFTIKVKEKENRKMTYTIAVVDEGLLDLTRFITPDPWNHFYSKEALGVKTWDIFDLVIGAYGGKLEHLLSLGGGEFEKPKEGTKVNRFKPMVKFLGPFTIDGDEGTHKIDVPRYVGSVRTMVIAGNKGAYGFDEKTTPVRKPLMVLGTLPRVLGPGETVELPVSVFAMEDNIKNVAVTIKTNDVFEIVDKNSKQITFTEKGDQLVNFKLKVKPKTGIAKVDIKVHSGNEDAEYNLELEVRNPNPVVVDVVKHIIKADDQKTQKVIPFGIEGTNNCVLEVSSIPPLNLGERLRYLIRYPHGCIEQTTSAAFPQLYLDRLLELTDEKKTITEKNIKRAIDRISLFQVTNGGFSYWPGKNEVSEWGTNYAGHFLIEAKTKGYNIPTGILTKWKKHQRNEARNWSTRANRSDLSQAYRLYTLALAGDPEIGAMNRLLAVTDLSKTAKFRLAAAYKLAGKPEVAEKLIESLDYNIDDYAELGNTFGSALRDKAMLLETVNLMGKENDSYILLKNISEDLNQTRWYNTQALSYALLAIGKFIGTNKISDEIEFEYLVNGGNSKDIISTRPIIQENIKIIAKEDKEITIINKTSTPLFVRIINEGKPITGDQTDTENKLSLTVKYFLLDGIELDPTKLEQGTDFFAEVTIKHPGNNIRRYQQMELHQIFPSGWEIINSRLFNINSINSGSWFDYQDIRDDRVYTFYHLNNAETKKIRILLNASYLGRFYLPTVYSQAMYDNTINARKHGQWVEIVLPGE